MSVRIDFYAVDVPPLEAFLNRSIGDALKYVVDNAREEDFVWFGMSGGRRYLASPSNGILDGTGNSKGYVRMSASDVDADPNLSVSCRDHLAQGDVGELRCLLDALAGSPATPWVQELSCGQRRWWIGSLLDWAERSQALETDEYAQYEDLFFKVLRGYSCAKLPAVQWSDLSRLDFPVLPAVEGDLRLGVWTEEEVELFILYSKHLLAFEPQLGAPPGFRERVSAEPDPWWNDWVHEMLGQLLRIETPGYKKPNAVTFIG